MATKLYSTSLSYLNQYYQLQIPYCNGIIIGAIELGRKFSKCDIPEYGNDIIANLRSLKLSIDGDYFIETEEYRGITFLYIHGAHVVEQIEDLFEEEDFKLPLCKSIKEAYKGIDHLRSINNWVNDYRGRFISLVDEKTFIQTSIAQFGRRTFEVTSFAFSHDPLYAAVERAAVYTDENGVGYYIPTAEEIFKIYHKILKRWGIEEEA